MRPSFDDWALGIAEAVSRRGDCTRRRVGAVLFDSEWRVLSVGYNGTEPGGKSCLRGECPRGRMSTQEVAPGSSYDTGPGACISIHAELNSLLYSDPLRRVGGTLAITCAPCDGCLRVIKGSGVARVIWPDGEMFIQ